MNVMKGKSNFFIQDSSLYIEITDLSDILNYKDVIDNSIENDVINVLAIIWNGQDIFSSLNHEEKLDLYRWLDLLPILSVIVVNNYCYGDLLELFMICDIRIGGSNLVISFPYDDSEFIFNFKERCKLLMGKQEVKGGYESLLKKTFHSKEIYKLRLINRIIDMEDMSNQVQKYINKVINNKSSYQIKAIMKCFNNYKNLGLNNNRELLLEQEFIQFCNLVTKEFFKKRL